MPIGDLYGWAICGKNLMKEMSKKTEVRYVPYPLYDGGTRDYETEKFVEKITATPNGGKFNYLQAIENTIPASKYKGSKNVGYMFYEDKSIAKDIVEGLKSYDVITTGSEWNSEVVRNHGFDNVVTIHQGVDCEIFKPMDSVFFKDKFVIFSGGKLEHRKGQDIVAYCVGKMQKKYDDVYLLASWTNLFDDENIHKNNINSMKGYLLSDKTMLIDMSLQKDVVRHIAETSIGLFPNRSEGGTNLVMMEYMACGKPVIANNYRGQKDVLSSDYAYLVSGKTDDDLIDEVMDALEFAYHARDMMKEKGVKAREAMQKLTWEKTADKFLEVFND